MPTSRLSVAWLSVMAVCSAFVYTAEHGVNTLMNSPFDALWWGVTPIHHQLADGLASNVDAMEQYLVFSYSTKGISRFVRRIYS